MAGDADAAIRRVRAALETGDALDTLGSQVSGADLTSFLLEVMRRRAEQLSPADVLRRARTDRFVEPGAVDARALHRVVAGMLPAIPDAFELVELSPVVPLGTHSTVATVHQHKIVSTVRAAEVAADPTNTLALLAALRRESGLPTAPATRLGAVQRILRAQPFAAQGQQHFSVLALVTAGRDRGNRAFETEAFIEQMHALRGAIAQITSAPVELRLTDLVDGDVAPLIDAVAATFADRPATTVVVDPNRESGRGYYRDLCFKLIVRTPTGEIECGDGGFTSWTQQLLGNRKERLLTSGLGLDRLVTVAANSPA